MTPEGRISTSIMKWLRSVPNNYCRKISDLNNVGIPDIDGCFRGVAYYFEVKSQRGRLTDRQEYEIKKIDAAGGRVAVVKSLSDVRTLFYEWFGFKK